MRILLGVFLIVIVSGEDETIIAHLEDNVLLPCSCPDKDLNKDMRWQMEKLPPTLVLKYSHPNITYVKDNRIVGAFLEENTKSCSILLMNVTVNDQGKYRCIFYKKAIYTYHFVHLKVHARYKVCQRDSAENVSDARVFHCDAVGSYPEAEIQWILDGQPLTESSDAHITHDKRLEATGFYHFNSTLIIKLNGTTQPTCNVKSERVQSSIEDGCSGISYHRNDPDPQDVRRRYAKVIPIVLLLVVLLVLWQSFRSHGVDQR